MVASTSESNSSSRAFVVFFLSGEGFVSIVMEMSNPCYGGEGISAMGFSSSLTEEKLREIAMEYHIPPRYRASSSSPL